MLLLINSNRMQPPILPLGLEYVASAVMAAGVDTEILDLNWSPDPMAALEGFLRSHSPDLIGIGFRNLDDCFWPSCQSFIRPLVELVARVHALSAAPVVLGGVGLSIIPGELRRRTGAEFAIHGDGERAILALYRALERHGSLREVPGLLFEEAGVEVCNPPAWHPVDSYPRHRQLFDHREYFRRGGQVGLETKRGCPRQCSYCADPLAKGSRVRQRSPEAVADEAEALLAQGIDTVHICDGEFNVPRRAAAEVCETFIRRGIGKRLRFYIYATVSPFDRDLARLLRRAGCVGIDFTGDSTHPQMLSAYGAAHSELELRAAVAWCREEGLTCMVDLLLGGPGEGPSTVAHTIESLRRMAPDCVGAALGMRLYPGTPAVARLAALGPLDGQPGIRRRYQGPVDLAQPTFFIAPELGPRPAALVRELIGQDPRFFPPANDDPQDTAGDEHNYNENAALMEAIARGARGAYWDILRGLSARQQGSLT